MYLGLNSKVLNPTSFFGDSPDPYVRVSLLHAGGYRKVLRTKAIKGTQDMMNSMLADCTFTIKQNNVLFFGLPEGIDLFNPENRRFVIRLEVYDEDFGKDDHIGQVSKAFVLNDTIIGTTQKWSLRSFNHEHAGQIQFEIRYGRFESYMQKDKATKADRPSYANLLGRGSVDNQRRTSPEEDEDQKSLGSGGDKQGIIIEIQTASNLKNPNTHLTDGYDTVITTTAALLVIFYFVLGGIFYCIHENWTVVNSVYFAVVTITTTGYGDLRPSTDVSKIFTCFYAFLGIGIVTSALGILGGYVIEEHRKMMVDAVNFKKLKAQEKEKLQESREANRSLGEYLGDMFTDIFKIIPRVNNVTIIALLILAGVIFFHYKEDLTWVNALYLSCISLATVGYGDLAPRSRDGRIFTIIWLTLGTIIIARAIADCLKHVVETRQKKMTMRKFKNKNLTQAEFEIFDEDGDGEVTRSEFLARMLVKMKKVEMTDIRLLLRMFKAMDVQENGYIVLDDYSEVNEAEQVNDDLHTPFSALRALGPDLAQQSAHLPIENESPVAPNNKAVKIMPSPQH